MGCFEEKLSKFWTLKASAKTLPHFESFENQQLTLIFYRADLQISLPLRDFFELLPDFVGCGAQKVTGFSDLGQSSFADGLLKLEQNPTIKLSGEV